MNKNIFSLLNSNWMFANNGESILYPFLFSMINGNSLISETLQETTHYFQSATGMQTAESPAKLPTIESVAILKVHHPIFKYDQNCGPKGTQTIMSMLEGWKKQDDIKGVVLDYNSPGGQVSGTAEFAEYIHNYPKPIVSFTKDSIGSAAYYMASSSKYIIAHKHADFIGSIGTMFKSIDLEGILEKKGGTIHEFYSDLSPEKNKASRALKNGDGKVLIKEFLNPMAKQFQNDVKLYRPNITEKALKGDVFNPIQSLKEGLIDQIGTLQNAIDKVFELSDKNKTQKQPTMSKEFKKIQAALGMETAFEMNENGVFVSQEQLQTIEDQLENQETAISDAQTAQETAIATATTPLNDSITALESEGTAVTTSINAALEAAEVERGEMSNAEAITKLSELVAEYGSKDGANHTNVNDDGSSTPEAKVTKVGGIDITAAMNN